MLINKEDFKAYINYNLTTYDTEITELLRETIATAENYCQNKITESDIVEIVDNTEKVFLSNSNYLRDVKAYNKDGDEWVEINNFYIKGRELVFDNANGKINGRKITYTCGFSEDQQGETNEYPLPADLKLAILKLAGALWNKRRSDGLGSEGLDGSSIAYTDLFTSDITSILDKYRIYIL